MAIIYRCDKCSREFDASNAVLTVNVVDHAPMLSRVFPADDVGIRITSRDLCVECMARLHAWVTTKDARDAPREALRDAPRETAAGILARSEGF